MSACSIQWCEAPEECHDPQEGPAIHFSPTFGVMGDHVTYNPDGEDPEDIWALDLVGGRFWADSASNLALELKSYADGIRQAAEWLEAQR